MRNIWKGYYTLLKTKIFKEELFKFFSNKYNLSTDDIKNVYEKMKHSLSVTDWILEFSKELQKKSNTTMNYTTNDLKELDFIPNTQVISYINKSDAKKVVFSYGNTKLQKYKLDRMNILNLFDDIIITQGPKLSLLHSMKNGVRIKVRDQLFDDITVIDNDSSFLKKVNSMFPFIKTVDVTNLISSNKHE